ncbi:MAG: Nif3-like dinuclear metal center hexameric protein, partial [Clostridiales bacterium]|nr:Nif3-like dinuclear metal center hexameric protein [Clostridiales bacterium]
ILLCLDINRDIIEKAVSYGCNLIVSHHPLIFSPLKSVDFDTRLGSYLELLIKNEINVVSYHTNIDKAEQGLSYEMAKRLQGENIRATDAEFGVLFDVKPIKLNDFAKKTAEVFSDKSIKISGRWDKTIKTVFAVSGSGGRDADAYKTAKENADVFLTAEVKHSFFLEAEHDGLSIIELSHHGSEAIVCDIFERALKPLDVKIIKANSECPFRTLEEI